MGQWQTGVLAPLLTPQILLTGVYGGWISWQVAERCARARREIQGEDYCSAGFLQSLRINAELGYSPYRRESFEQCAMELGCTVSELPQFRTQDQAGLLNTGVQSASQGPQLLRQALSEMEEVGRSNTGEEESTYTTASRSLADSHRYRQLGNAVCVPVAEWIGRRLVAVAV